MLTRRLSIILATIFVVPQFPTTASAGRLLDWLFGRREVVYVAQYPTVATSSPFGTVPAGAPASNGAFQVQRPAYFDNPSVYTGLPVNTNLPVIWNRPTLFGGPAVSARPVITAAPSAYPVYQLPAGSTGIPLTTQSSLTTSARVPIAGTLRGTGTLHRTGTPLAGSGTIITSNFQAAAPNGTTVISPTTNQPSNSTVVTGTPLTSVPATNVTPLFVNTPQPRVGGLARFFSSLLGTNYRTTYYRAPITYYRPVTTVDPITGATITVQQPCASYVQQLQRIPYSTFQGATGTVVAQPGASCQVISPLSTTTYPPLGNVGQVGGLIAPGTSGVTQIPTVAPGLNPQPNLAPLLGTPGASRDDLAPMNPPQLQSSPNQSSPQQTLRPPVPPAESSSDMPKSYWDDNEASNSKDSAPAQGSATRHRLADPQNLTAPNFTQVQPIQAPDDYRSPFKRRLDNRSSTLPKTAAEPFVAPRLPPQNDVPAGATSVSARRSIPVHDASLTRRPSRPQPTKPAPRPARSSGWYTVQP
ncbi:MAG: hypothetical protein MI861_07870 [Pirellulales bacterium]|nr:hypothetical protein [Pirellulales bacterium]